GNRLTILSFKLYGRKPEDLFGLVEGIVGSFRYDEDYGFGEAPRINVVKILWHYMVPGIGIMIVIFFLYKWVASEYG
ncbi:MAG: hypothetical protein ACYSSO_10895, partial [Planctomycetota bacterium]